MRNDYSTYGSFRAIDRLNEGEINFENIKRFFRNQSSYLSDREVMAIIRRIDTDGDAKINYSEFSDFFRCMNPP